MYRQLYDLREYAKWVTGGEIKLLEAMAFAMSVDEINLKERILLVIHRFNEEILNG